MKSIRIVSLALASACLLVAGFAAAGHVEVRSVELAGKDGGKVTDDLELAGKDGGKVSDLELAGKDGGKVVELLAGKDGGK